MRSRPTANRKHSPDYSRGVFRWQISLGAFAAPHAGRNNLGARKIFVGGEAIAEALDVDVKTWEKFIRLNKQHCVDEDTPPEDWPADYAPPELLSKDERGRYAIAAWALVHLRSYMDGERSSWGRPPQPRGSRNAFAAWTSEALHAWLLRCENSNKLRSALGLPAAAALDTPRRHGASDRALT